MEQYIQRAGGHMPALEKIVKVDMRVVYTILTQLTASPRAERAAVLETVTNTLDEFFDCIQYALYNAYHDLPDKHARDRYLAKFQRTLLELTGHLLKDTQPAQLYGTPSRRRLADTGCHHLYQALERLLEYTVRLAGEQVDRTLPLPLSVRPLFLEMLTHDLAALRTALVARHVSPRLVDIALAPFEAPPAAYNLFYTVRYLRDVKQALWQLTADSQQTIGDTRVLHVLMAHDFNAPAFMEYCQAVMLGQQEADGSENTHSRWMGAPRVTTQSLHPYRPSALTQLTQWLAQPMPTPAPPKQSQPIIDVEEKPLAGETHDYTKPLPPLSDYFTTILPLRVLGAILHAAFELNLISWGKDDSRLSELVAQLVSHNGQVKAETIRRGFNDLRILAKAREVLQRIVDFLNEKIAELENNLG
jgi:hypothetical protein